MLFRSAVAVPIDKDSTLAAGGFILPNDRVDIVRSASRAERGQEFEVETILTDIRVLAVGQTSIDRGGDRNISAVNATLEVTPAQPKPAARQRGRGEDPRGGSWTLWKPIGA